MRELSRGAGVEAGEGAGVQEIGEAPGIPWVCGIFSLLCRYSGEPPSAGGR